MLCPDPGVRFFFTHLRINVVYADDDTGPVIRHSHCFEADIFRLSVDQQTVCDRECSLFIQSFLDIFPGEQIDKVFLILYKKPLLRIFPACGEEILAVPFQEQIVQCRI